MKTGFSEAEVRTALLRITASEPFRNAPQLVSFLTFVVERKLAGAGSRNQGIYDCDPGARASGGFRSADRPDRAGGGGPAAAGARNLLPRARQVRPGQDLDPARRLRPEIRRSFIRIRRRTCGGRRAPGRGIAGGACTAATGAGRLAACGPGDVGARNGGHRVGPVGHAGGRRAAGRGWDQVQRLRRADRPVRHAHRAQRRAFGGFFAGGHAKHGHRRARPVQRTRRHRPFRGPARPERGPLCPQSAGDGRVGCGRRRRAPDPRKERPDRVDPQLRFVAERTRGQPGDRHRPPNRGGRRPALRRAFRRSSGTIRPRRVGSLLHPDIRLSEQSHGGPAWGASRLPGGDPRRATPRHRRPRQTDPALPRRIPGRLQFADRRPSTGHSTWRARPWQPRPTVRGRTRR